MIVPMRKLFLLVFHQDYRDFLEELRERGVLHVHENRRRSAENEALQGKLRQIKRLNELIRILENREVAGKEECAEVSDADLPGYIEEQYRRQDQIAARLGTMEKEVALYEPWGHFSRERVEALARAGWDLRFYTVPDRKYLPEWEERFHAMVISEWRGQKYFVTVTPSGEQSVPDADVFVFPQESEESLRSDIGRLRQEREELSAHLDGIAADSIVRLKRYRETICESTDFLEVEDASVELVEQKVIALEGWLPADREDEMKAFLQERGVYFEFSAPSAEDDVPVLLKNGKFARLFEPVTEMFALPNYHELDPTPFFAPFFMLFFGLCMGDGGYGLLIWAFCFFMMRRVSPSLKGYLVLGQILGFATVVVGVLTGSFFGIALDSVEWQWLKGVKHYFVTDANYKQLFGGYSPMMVFAVVIGIFQILFGMCLSAVKVTSQSGFRYAVSTVAWVVGLVLLGVTFGLPAMGVVLPVTLDYLFYGIIAVCAFVVLFMNSPGKGVLANVGSAVWETYNMATGLLGDTLSYIRLFALGLTGSILGGVFNTLAFDLTASIGVMPVRFISVFLILLVGHAINFGLCIIGAFVHPMRLTFVEFYKNEGFEGGGRKYSPFRRRVTVGK